MATTSSILAVPQFLICGVAVLVVSLTTIVGYGALMVATHQGLQSLGRVLTIGVTMCLFSSLVLLPALLAIVTRNRPTEEPTTDSADADPTSIATLRAAA